MWLPPQLQDAWKDSNQVHILPSKKKKMEKDPPLVIYAHFSEVSDDFTARTLLAKTWTHDLFLFQEDKETLEGVALCLTEN